STSMWSFPLGWTTTTPNCCVSSRTGAAATSWRSVRHMPPAADCSAGCAILSPVADRFTGFGGRISMVATLFYVDALADVGELAQVSGDEGFHAATVRRIRPGEQLVLGDGRGGLAHCIVEHAGRDGLSARVQERWSVTPTCPSVTVVQALPKSDRSELAVELATE